MGNRQKQATRTSVTPILLQDNGDATNPGGACKDTAALVANVPVNYSPKKKKVEFCQCRCKGMQGIPSIKTATDGSYVFSSIPMPVHGGDQHVSKPSEMTIQMNGVSTSTWYWFRNISWVQNRWSPHHKMIAADVDNNNDITAIDLLELQNWSWVFMISYRNTWAGSLYQNHIPSLMHRILGSILQKMYWLIWQKNEETSSVWRSVMWIAQLQHT